MKLQVSDLVISARACLLATTVLMLALCPVASFAQTTENTMTDAALQAQTLTQLAQGVIKNSVSGKCEAAVTLRTKMQQQMVLFQSRTDAANYQQAISNYIQSAERFLSQACAQKAGMKTTASPSDIISAPMGVAAPAALTGGEVYATRGFNLTDKIAVSAASVNNGHCAPNYSMYPAVSRLWTEPCTLSDGNIGGILYTCGVVRATDGTVAGMAPITYNVARLATCQPMSSYVGVVQPEERNFAGKSDASVSSVPSTVAPDVSAEPSVIIALAGAFLTNIQANRCDLATAGKARLLNSLDFFVSSNAKTSVDVKTFVDLKQRATDLYKDKCEKEAVPDGTALYVNPLLLSAKNAQYKLETASSTTAAEINAGHCSNKGTLAVAMRIWSTPCTWDGGAGVVLWTCGEVRDAQGKFYGYAKAPYSVQKSMDRPTEAKCLPPAYAGQANVSQSEIDDGTYD